MATFTAPELVHFPPENSDDEITNQRQNEDHRRSEWWRSACIIAGEIMGTGVLSLPYACSRLGWALGLTSSVAFGCTAIYSGRLLSHCRNVLYPDATSYADLALRVGGPGFGKFTRIAIAVGWASILPYYLVACAASLEAAFPAANLCYWQWSLIVMLFAAPVLQYRSLHGLSILSLLSTGAIVIVVTVLCAALISTSPSNTNSTIVVQRSFGLPPDQSFLRLYASFGSFIFAYQGQSVFLEIMREMRQPEHFTRALYAANGLMMLVYTMVSAVGYGAYGDQVAGFLPDTLPSGSAKALVGVLLAFHTMVSYLLTGQPLMRVLHYAIAPSTADKSTPMATIHWAALTLSSLLAAFFVANLIPFFADLQDILGNTSGAATVFGWPAYFFLKGSAKRGRPVSHGDRFMCYFFLLVCLPAFTLLGTTNAILTLVADFNANEAPRPFQCKPR